MVEEPLVTVIALCYNHSSFLDECLESIRCQSLSGFQLIITDDASADESAGMIRSFADSYHGEVDLILHTENRGICATLNEALALARGKYVSIIATDDVMLPDKLADQVAFFESLDEDVAVIYGDSFRMDDHGNPLPGTVLQRNGKAQAPPEGHILSTLIRGNFIPVPSTLIRRECYGRVGTYDENLLYEDWDMWLRIALCHRFAYYPPVKVKYRVHGGNISDVLFRSSGKSERSDLLSFEKLARSRGLSRSDGRIVRRKIRSCASKLFRAQAEDRAALLWGALRLAPSPGVVLMLLMYYCIPGRFESAAVVKIQGMKAALRRLLPRAGSGSVQK
jgi:glycosyltransferase involved in cell wall biosynthesis